MFVLSDTVMSQFLQNQYVILLTAAPQIEQNSCPFSYPLLLAINVNYCLANTKCQVSDFEKYVILRVNFPQ